MKPKKTISHKDALRYICDHLGTPDDSERCRTIRKHLEGCMDCSHELASLQKTVQLFRHYPEPTPSLAARKRLRTTLKKLQ